MAPDAEARSAVGGGEQLKGLLLGRILPARAGALPEHLLAFLARDRSAADDLGEEIVGDASTSRFCNVVLGGSAGTWPASSASVTP
jgi:hypothetical protein